MFSCCLDLRCLGPCNQAPGLNLWQRPVLHWKPFGVVNWICCVGHPYHNGLVSCFGIYHLIRFCHVHLEAIHAAISPHFLIVANYLRLLNGFYDFLADSTASILALWFDSHRNQPSWANAIWNSLLNEINFLTIPNFLCSFSWFHCDNHLNHLHEWCRDDFIRPILL